MTAAGSTITQDVPDNALSIARARQENKPDYADKVRAKYQCESECIVINNEKPQYEQL
jgi:bifunctional UDP-N-acetylglucosamine pyrophosphorylase/glucosamine-1-phosphate N-acetyltransferase